MWCSCLLIVLSCYALLTSASCSWSSRSGSQPLFEAVYVFGDSLVDNGNNNHLLTFAKANYAPYGIDFPQGATGRFSNGRTIADWIAEYVGLPHPPAYWSKPRPRLGWLTGFNYASSLCGILKETSSHMRGGCYHLHQQMNFFEHTINQVLKPHYSNSPDVYRHLSKSLFVFVIGSNDYLNNYLSSFYPDSKKYTPTQFAHLLLDQLSLQLQRLYSLGARKVIFAEIAPIGCMTVEFKRHGKCNETKNEIVSKFNHGLEPLFTELTSKLQGSQFVVAKTYNLTREIGLYPSKYGFTNCIEPCCESVFDGYLKCKKGRKACNNRDQYCFWDPHHPTEAVTRLVVDTCFQDESMCGINKLLS